MRIQLEVLAWRGPVPESRHRLQAAASDPDGRLHLETAEPGLVTTIRSAAKPFQLLPLVERGHADRWNFSDEHLAVMASSHTGSAYHRGLVTEILDRISLRDTDLACGYHDPGDPESLAGLEGSPETRSKLYNNCSGKHAGMLCLARSEGWPIRGYERGDHPVQGLIREAFAAVAGMTSGSMAEGVDGCSAVSFGLPVAAMARAWARLAAARSGGDDRERALVRIRGAMMRHPVAVEGNGRLSTQLMQRSAGRLVSKGGAEGVLCVGVPDRNLGIALKVEDGQARALGPAIVAVFESLEILSEKDLAGLNEIRRPVVQNHKGLDVGVIEATLRHLTPAAS